MEQLVQKLVDELGLDETIARQAIQIVLGMLKDKFPEPIAGQIENFLNTGEVAESGDNGIMGTISGLFGKK